MTLRLQLLLALIGASLLGVLIAFAVAAMLPNPVLAGPFAAVLAAALVAALSNGFASTIAGALTDLQLVIHRFMKWDMDGLVPHASRADEVGDIAKALKAFQTDAIKWSEMHKSEQNSQVQLRLATQQRTEELIHQFRGSIAGILGAFADSARTMDETARALSTVATDTNERRGRGVGFR